MADEAQAVDRLGSVIDGRYRLLDVLASGAMGAVYKAERIPVGKFVAVKFLHASVAQDDEFQARFERETRVMSKLAHPNCVSVIDFGVAGGTPYLVMDHVAGTTLRATMDDGPIPAGRALALARQIAAGLAHAHDQGVIHRDIKPANIMITEEIGHGERVRILDFGLARLRASGEFDRDATRANMVVGTPNYMAPEQTVPGSSIDARADIYAAGVVLFEMIAGERPFQADDTLQLLGMHRAAPIPRLIDRVPNGISVPAGLQELIDKAMAKSPDDRYQTAMDLALALDEVIVSHAEGRRSSASLGDTTPDADVASLRRRHGLRAGAVAAVVAIGGGAALAGYVLSRTSERAETTSAHVAATRNASNGHSFDAAAERDDARHAAGSDRGRDAGTGETQPDANVSNAHATAAQVGATDESIELDPEAAEDLDPGQGSGAVAEDEAENAPKTSDEVEQNHASPTLRLASTLREAVQQISSGQRDNALASLRALHKKSPKSAYIPFLIGNLYFDQRWWSVAMDYYGEAIKKNSRYRRNPVINRNVINMLSSARTRQRASNFIRGSIGHSAGPYLRTAAVHGANSTIRRQAAALARVVR